MKKPETIEQFKSLIKSMNHRERFVFPYAEQDQQMESVEIYAALVDGGSRGEVMNITTTIVDILGKPVGKNKLSKYLPLWNENWWDTVYNQIIGIDRYEQEASQ